MPNFTDICNSSWNNIFPRFSIICWRRSARSGAAPGDGRRDLLPSLLAAVRLSIDTIWLMGSTRESILIVACFSICYTNGDFSEILLKLNFAISVFVNAFGREP